MKSLEKILIGLVLIAGFVYNLSELGVVNVILLFHYSIYFILIFLIIFYITQCKLSIFSLVLALLVFEPLSNLYFEFKADSQWLFYIISSIGSAIFSILLIERALKVKDKLIRRFYFAISFVLILQFIIVFIPSNSLNVYRQILFYTLPLIIAGLKIKGSRTSFEFQKILNIYLLADLHLITLGIINYIK